MSIHSAAEMVASSRKRIASQQSSAQESGEVLGGAKFQVAQRICAPHAGAGWYTWQGECMRAEESEPDLAVENSLESLATGVDAQLGKALEVVKTL